MFRFVLRFVGVWLFAAAMVMAVVDGAKTIAASSLVLTPVAEVWAIVARQEAAGAAPAGPLAEYLPFVMPVPAAVLFAVLGVLLLVAGRRPRHFSLSREFAT